MSRPNRQQMSYHENLYDGLEKDSAGMIKLANPAGSTTTGLPSDSASRSRLNPQMKGRAD